MTAILRSTVILGFARLSRHAISFLSPIFMVRLLSIEQYGEYRDFLLYGTILFFAIEFSINSSLAYFVPKEPQKERLYFTQASFFVLCSSAAVAVLVILFGPYFPSDTVRTHLVALSLYLLFFSNVDAWEVYWIAKKQTVNVLYYSLYRLGFRTITLIATAYLTNDVGWVIRVLVIFELLRLLVMSGYAWQKKLFVARLEAAAAKAQLAFFAPLGAGHLIHVMNVYMGQFFVSAFLGPRFLAVYAVGTFLYPIIHVFRGSIGDVIMPEIVSRREEEPKVALRLWQRATVIYCAVMLPLAVLLFHYAGVVVRTLFTDAYSEAAPIFQVFVLLLVRECFDFSLPLRVVNRTRVFFLGSLFSLVLNLILMWLLFNRYGIVGPALAMVITRFVAGVYYGAYVMKYCSFSLRELLPWPDMARAAVICLVCAPILYACDQLPIGELARALLAGVLYSAAISGLLYRSGIPEIREFFVKVGTRLGARNA